MNNKIYVSFRDILVNNHKIQIMETIAFGFKISINTELKPQQDQYGWYLSYNPTKAFLKANSQGYITLIING